MLKFKNITDNIMKSFNDVTYKVKDINEDVKNTYRKITKSATHNLEGIRKHKINK